MNNSDLFTIPDYGEIRNNFFLELKSSFAGNLTSLLTIHHKLPKLPIIKSGERKRIQVIVIGGTNYIVVPVLFDGISYQPVNSERKQGVLSSFKTATDFYQFIQSHIDKKIDAIAINLGFPLKPVLGNYGELDSILLRGGKGHALKGLVGQQIGLGIQTRYENQYNKKIPVTVAHDGVCLGLADNGDATLIVATGFNMGTIIDDHGQLDIINLESGSFDKFEPTDELLEIDKLSNNPGSALYEKMLSGKYLPAHFNLLSLKNSIHAPLVSKGEEISKLAANDKGKAGELGRFLFKRSASLVACQIAGLYDFRGKPKHMKIIAEGSVYTKAWRYKELINDRLKLFGIPADTITFTVVKNSSVKGALGLLRGEAYTERI